MRNFAAMYRFKGIGLVHAAIAMLISSCNTRLEESNIPSEGVPGEVFVVCDEDKLEAVKDAFDNYYQIFDSTLLVSEKATEGILEKKHAFWFGRSQTFEGSEKLASVIVVFGDAGKYSSDLTRIHPIESATGKAGYSMQVFRNVWSKPQTVIRLRHGRDLNAAKILKNGGAAEISELLCKFELAQGLPGNLSANHYTDSVSNVIQKNYGFTFQFPPQFRLMYSNAETVWLQQETGKFYRHLFVNIFSDNMALDSAEHAIANRNEFTLRYLKNKEGTKTTVSRSSAFPVTWKTEKAGKYNVKVLRGWYQEEGTFRRGPFVRYFFHDKAGHRYIAFDGFVYAPDTERRPYYRLFDIMAQSVQLP